jgi:hypothetical protein
MPRYKKINVQSSKSKENISDIFDEIKNDEKIKIKKIINNDNDNESKNTIETKETNETIKETTKESIKNSTKELKILKVTKKVKDSKNNNIHSDKNDSDCNTNDLSKKKQKRGSSVHDDKYIQQKTKEKNKIKMEKLAVIESLCKEYPCLKKDKDKIIKKHLEEKKEVKNPFVQNDYTLEKIIIEEKTYYKDDYNNILDENIKLVGFYKDLKTKYEFILFPITTA